MMKRKLFVYLLSSILLLTACVPAPAVEDPGLVFTVVASTQTAAAWQTQMAEASFAKTPTQATLRPTLTLFPTMTPFVYQLTASPTFTSTTAPTRTPSMLAGWPTWITGEVVTMPRGSGANIGTNKKFNILVGVKVIITRRNGVKLRSVPNKAIPGPLEEPGSVLTLTGIMNLNKEYGWTFAQVRAADGNEYWVGGTVGEDTDPKRCFEFYYPHLTESPTPEPTDTQKPQIGTSTVTFSPTRTPKPTLTITPWR